MMNLITIYQRKNFLASLVCILDTIFIFYNWTIFIFRFASGVEFNPPCHGAFITHCSLGFVCYNYLCHNWFGVILRKPTQNMF